MYLSKDSQFEIAWVDSETTDRRMAGARYYEMTKEFCGEVTHKVSINDWSDTLHGGYWITITDAKSKLSMAFEVSEWSQVCAIVNGIV